MPELDVLYVILPLSGGATYLYNKWIEYRKLRVEERKVQIEERKLDLMEQELVPVPA